MRQTDAQPIADIWPTGDNQTWTDSRGYTFKMTNWIYADMLGWMCTYSECPDPCSKEDDLFFVDADKWPWEDRGQNHPGFLHYTHFSLVSRPGKEQP